MIVKKNKKGFGVYADRQYKKGEKICEMKGKKVTPKNLAYIMSSFQKSMVNPLQIGVNKYMEIEKPYLFINHSCEPNAAIIGKNTLIAIKNIKKGEEILYDYAATIDESFVCRCGSKKCRGAIGDFFTLSKSAQKRYFKLGLQDFIKNKYKKCCGK